MVAFVRGVQSRGVAACAKHFVANDAEIERLTISSDVDERTLREVYLRPFEAAVRDGNVWTVMASYNRINGTYACEHAWLLSTVLKGEWGFDGLVMSDWFATHATVTRPSLGSTWRCPDRRRTSAPRWPTRCAAGEVPRRRGRRRRPAGCCGSSTGWASTTVRAPGARRSTIPAGGTLAVEASAASMVLLRNADRSRAAPLLPLDPGALQRVAVIGPNADMAVVQGGGSARVTPHRTVTPLAGLRARLGAGVDDRLTSRARATERGCRCSTVASPSAAVRSRHRA